MGLGWRRARPGADPAHHPASRTRLITMTADSLLIPNARLRTRDRVITVPVDRENPSRFGTLQVFAREVVDPAKDSQDLPLLLFLQGGPGGSSPET